MHGIQTERLQGAECLNSLVGAVAPGQVLTQSDGVLHRQSIQDGVVDGGGSIGGEVATGSKVKTVTGAQQAEVALLHEIERRERAEARAGALDEGDGQPEVS